jgi:hypothetical protein
MASRRLSSMTEPRHSQRYSSQWRKTIAFTAFSSTPIWAAYSIWARENCSGDPIR